MTKKVLKKNKHLKIFYLLILMVRYECYKCNKIFDHKGNYERHINRKRSCINNNKNKKLSENKEINNEIYDSLKDNDISKIKKLLNLLNNNSDSSDNFSDSSLEENEELKKKPVCKYCNTTFHNKSNLKRHIKKGCKNYYEEEMNRKLKEKNDKIEKLKEEVDKLKKSQHITNNINVIAYNKTPDVSHLSNKDYLKIMNRGFSSVPKLIEAIHYNPDKPENQNIYIPNIKNNYAMVWNGDKWDLSHRDEIIEDMYDDKSNFLIEKLEEFGDKVNTKYPNVVKKFKRFMAGKDDDFIKNKIKEDIKLLLYNNKSMVNKKK